MRPRAAELAWALATVALTCVLSAVALKLWQADLRVPFSYGGDGNQNQLFIKGVLDHGWYQHNPSLGAPFGQDLRDFPVVSGDNLQIVLMKAIGIFTSDSALVMNLFFLLTFPLTALIAYAVLRLLDISRPASAAAAVLYALAPYHFIRGEYHLFIAAYYAVPLGAYLVVSVLLDRAPLFTSEGEDRARRRIRLALVVAACVIIGSAHVYYAAFAILLLAIAALGRLVVGGRRAACAAGVLVALIAAVVVANHLPNALYRADHGVNKSLERAAYESETYGLKLDELLLPVPHHRIGALARIRDDYEQSTPGQLREGGSQALGTVAALGLVGLLLLALVALVRRARDPDARVTALAAAALAAILIATVGGLSGLFAHLVTPQLRAWGRMAIFVDFFALAAVALAADRLRPRAGLRAVYAALAVVVAIGFLDQTNAASAPQYDANAASYRSDAALVDAIEQRLPPGSAVFELPYEPFPEPQPAWQPSGVGPYDMGRPYLHSHGLRWSYGLMKGRAGDWQHALVLLPPALVARGVAAAGFDGIYVNLPAYADRGDHLMAALREELGSEPLGSPDGRTVFFDIRGYAKRLRSRAAPAPLARAVLRPLNVELAGFSAARHSAEARFHFTQEAAEIVISNPSSIERRATFAATFAAAADTLAQVTLGFPGERPEVVEVDTEGSVVIRELALPPGESIITVQVAGRPQFGFPQVTRPYYLRVEDPVLVDSAFTPFGAIPRDRRAAAFLSPFGVI